MTEERCVVDVLWIPYSVNITPEADDPKLETMDGYTDPSIKRIVVSDVHRRPDDPENVQDQDWFQRNIIRHELIHAFVVESGNQDALWHTEDMVRWLAYMFPRLLVAFKEAGAMEPCGKGVVYPGVADELNYYNSIEASRTKE